MNVIDDMNNVVTKISFGSSEHKKRKEKKQ